MIQQQYIVVDDDPMNNKLCNYAISKAFPDAIIHCFEFPLKALQFIMSEYDDLNKVAPTVLFLDINMPEINGWEFLEEFAAMGKHIHDQITIYIVSSSIDPADREKAEANSLVKAFLSKPLNPVVLKSL